MCLCNRSRCSKLPKVELPTKLHLETRGRDLKYVMNSFLAHQHTNSVRRGKLNFETTFKLLITSLPLSVQMCGVMKQDGLGMRVNIYAILFGY